ncbi:MAG: glycosyltransferase family 2 protein [Tenuifilaceae bacterium]|nr:glycosyltransferase family 2 protein [Tenuifilaceae bacterium]
MNSLMISIILVNYNAGPLLARCIASALPQAQDILVIDNASQDDSIALCQKEFSCAPQVRIFQNDKNLGFAAACNQGIRYAKGDFILFLNPDCLLSKKALSTLMDALLSDPRAGMAGGLLLNPDGREQEGGRRAIPTPWRAFVRAFGLHRLAGRFPELFFDFHLHTQPLPSTPCPVEAISGSCMLVKRETIADVGPWDEGYFLHCEDLDWCMRMGQKGWKILFVPSAPVFHTKGACSKSRPLFVEWHKHKGMIRFYRKFFSKDLPLPVMLLVVLGVWARFSLVSLKRLVAKP